MKIRLVLLACLGAITVAYQVNAQTTFRNPIITGMNPDPGICRAGDDYYLVTSTFEYFPGLPIYQSKDLVHWKLIGYALSQANQNPLIGCDPSGLLRLRPRRAVSLPRRGYDTERNE